MASALVPVARSSPPLALRSLSLFQAPSSSIPQTLLPQRELVWKSVADNPTILQLLKSIFEKTLEPLYGVQTEALSKIAKGIDRTSYLVFDKDMPVGVLVYKKAPSDEFEKFGVVNSLEIKSLFLVDPEKNSGKGLASVLLEKVVSVAKGLGVPSLHVTVSDRVPDSIAFFSKKRFAKITTFDSRYKSGIQEHLFRFNLRDTEPQYQSPILERGSITQMTPLKKTSPQKKRRRDSSIEAPQSPGTSSQSQSSAPSLSSSGNSAKGKSSYLVKRGKSHATSISSSLSSSAQQSVVDQSSSDNSITSPTTFRGIRIKRIYLEMIKQGTKTIEGRVHKGIFKTFKAGDGIRFFIGLEHSVRCIVTQVNVYPSFEKMLETENFKRFIPTMETSKEVLTAYHKIPGYLEKSQEHGVVAFHLQNVEPAKPKSSL